MGRLRGNRQAEAPTQQRARTRRNARIQSSYRCSPSQTQRAPSIATRPSALLLLTSRKPLSPALKVNSPSVTKLKGVASLR